MVANKIPSGYGNHELNAQVDAVNWLDAIALHSGGITSDKNHEQRVVPKLWRDQLATLIGRVWQKAVVLDVEDYSDGRRSGGTRIQTNARLAPSRRFYFRYG